MKILVTTPNGKVGSLLVPALQKRGANLRLGAHTVEKARAAFPGLEVVRLDHGEPSTYGAALQGIDGLYLASPGDSPSAPEKALVDAAKRAGVKKIVKLAAMGIEASDNPLRQVEEHIRASGLPFTLLHPTWFMQNFSTSGAAGIKAGTMAEPAGDGRTAFIDCRDIADVAAEALTRSGHDGRTYTLTGPESLTRHQVAEVIGRVIGRTVTYVPVTDEQFRAAVKGVLPPSYVELLSALYAGVRAGWTDRTTDEVRQVLGRAPIGIEAFARDHRAAWT